jgi:hypothetical protein
VGQNFAMPAFDLLLRLHIREYGPTPKWRSLANSGLMPRRRQALYLPVALALLFFAISPLAHAQQLTRVPPFVGTHSETWERFGVSQIPSGTSILGGIATISGDQMITATRFTMCLVNGRPSDGTY